MTRSRKLSFTGFLIFLVYLIYLSAMTLYPFQFSNLWLKQYLSLGLKEAILFLFNIGRLDIILNILLFIPFGLILFSFLKELKISDQRRLWTIIFMALFLSGLIETLQLLLPRTASLVDIASNTFGSILGFYIMKKRPDITLKTGIIIRNPVFKFFAIFITGCIFVGFLFLPFLFNHIGNWNPQFHFLLGNEETKDRPWTGKIYRIAFYSKQLQTSQVQTLYQTGIENNQHLFINESMLELFYPFSDEEGDTIHDFSHSLEPLPLLGAKGCWLKNRQGIEIKAGHQLRSKNPCKNLVHRLQKPSQFSLELWFRTKDLLQGGPARIVTLSSDPEHRNFTLGQQNRDIHFRVRTPLAGLNGSTINLIAHNVLQDLEMHQVVVTFHRGVERLFIDGIPHAQFIRGDIDYLPILLKMGQTRIVKYLLIFMIAFPFAFMLGLLISKHLLLWNPVLMFGFAVIIEILIDMLFGQPFLLLIPMISGVGGLMAALMWETVSNPSHPLRL